AFRFGSLDFITNDFGKTSATATTTATSTTSTKALKTTTRLSTSASSWLTTRRKNS
uniref:Uncharacterized protein n=1 Tax=Oryza glaberrima TaxID=4538 RepID=I1QRS9_ORYGL